MKKVLNLQAWDLMPTELEDTIVNGSFSEINFIWQHEWEISLPKNVIKHINDNKIKIIVVTCIGDYSQLLESCIKMGINSDLLTCAVWPDFWFIRSHFYMNQIAGTNYKNLNNDNYQFKIPFISLNGRYRHYRAEFIDTLAKFNFIKDGCVSFHQEYKQTQTYDWKYHDGSILTIDDNYENTSDTYLFNDSFINSFLHIPTESTIDVFLMSEKTAMPILCKKPFIVLGAVGYHKSLQTVLGIEPYDEIFDYSFDSEPDLSKRITMMMKNIKFVIDNKDSLNILYSKIKDKIERNYRRAIDSVENFEKVPEIIKKYYLHIEDTKNPINGFDIELLNFNNHFQGKIVNDKLYEDRKMLTHKLYYDLWDNFSYEHIIHDLETQKPSKIVIAGENEWEPWFTQEFVQAFNKSDCKLLYITGCKDEEFAKNKFLEAGITNRFSIQYFPTFWFNFTLNALPNHKSIARTADLKYPFISLNNRGHVHRLLYLDEMAKRTLIDKGVVTWHDILNENTHIKLDYFNRNKKLKIDDDFDTKLNSFLIPKQYQLSLFDFVTECCHEAVMISEKTATPILLRKPFVVLGAPFFHKYLEELGFKLYDEVIDYSFDSETDLKKRVELYVNNVEKVSKLENLNEVRRSLKAKLNHNYINYFKIIQNINLVPKEIQNILHTIPANENIQLSNCQIKYKNIVGRFLK